MLVRELRVIGGLGPASPVWDMVRETVDAAPGLPRGVALSRGDRLTLVVDTAARLAGDLAVSRRMYLTVLAVLEGQAEVEVLDLGACPDREPGGAGAIASAWGTQADETACEGGATGAGQAQASGQPRVVAPYDDTTDREYWAGSGARLALRAGWFLVVSPQEAVRLTGGDGLVAELHVTRQGSGLYGL